MTQLHLNKVNSVTTQTDATDFETLMLGQSSHNYENQFTTEGYCLKEKSNCKTDK